MQNSPEFQLALNEAAERAYREFIYGGVGPKAKSRDDVGKALEKISRIRADTLKKADALKGRSEAMKHRAMAGAAARGITMTAPPMPEERTRESMEAHRAAMKVYAEKMRTEHERRTNPHLREITENIKRKTGVSGLICPMCGERDHGNTLDGRPVCLMNAKHKGLGPVVLMTPEKAANWKPPDKKFKFKEPWELDESTIARKK